MTEQTATARIALESEVTKKPRRRPNPRRSIVRSITVPLATLIVFVILWEIAVQANLISRFIVPPPSAVGSTLTESVVEIFTGGRMQLHFFTTLIEILAGFSLAVIIGTTLAVLMSEWSLVREMLHPYIVALNATPTIALAPLFIVWFGVGIDAKIFLVLVGATFPVIVSTMAGLISTDPKRLRLMQSLGATRAQVFWKLRLPSAIPYFFAGLELAIVASSIGAIVGEFSGGNTGLGYVTLLAQDSLNLPLTFATLILLALLGITLHRLVVFARHRILFWAK